MANSNTLPTVLFKQDVELMSCVNQPVEFETDEMLLDGGPNYIDEDKDDDSDCEDDHKSDDFIESSYEKLWDQMPPMDSDNLVRKIVLTEGVGDEYVQDTSIIRVHYVGYCENSKNPIAYSSEKEPEIINMKDEKHLIGFNMALKSMRMGETSRFLISHKVMYGALGCPPLIPPKAKCLFTITVLDIRPLQEDDPGEENLTTFQRVYKVAKDFHVRGVFFYRKTDYGGAIRSFRQAVKLMELCRLVDEVEEQKQEKFLSKLYVNLTICYNNIGMPLKACCMCNNLGYLGRLWNNSKALLHNARALSMLGEYRHAQKRLNAALAVDPDNEDIKKEVEVIRKKKEDCEKYRKMLATSMSSNSVSDKQPTITFDEDFGKSVDKFLAYFKDNKELFKTILPLGLTKSESDIVRECAKKYDFFCQSENDIVASISKMEIKDNENLTTPVKGDK